MAKKEKPPKTIDRLTALRRDITDQSAVTDLLDILIDEHGGDSAALAEERLQGAEQRTADLDAQSVDPDDLEDFDPTDDSRE